MIARRAFSSMVFRAGHACMRTGCKVCAARIATHAISRPYSAAANKLAKSEQSNNKEYDLSRLSKPFEKEIEFQQKLITNEQLNTGRVLTDYGKLIGDNAVKVEDDGTTKVRLVIPRGEGVKYVVSFDSDSVANAINAAGPQSEEGFDEEDEEAGGRRINESELDEDYDEDAEEDYGEQMPLMMTIEVHRESQPDKHVVFEAEATPSSKPNQYDLFVTYMGVVNESVQTDYSGPGYESLDEKLREQLDQFVAKNFAKYVPLIAEYSRAKEGQLYSQWLRDVKQVLAA